LSRYEFFIFILVQCYPSNCPIFKSPYLGGREKNFKIQEVIQGVSSFAIFGMGVDIERIANVLTP
jgi:hypothetical protein